MSTPFTFFPHQDTAPRAKCGVQLQNLVKTSDEIEELYRALDKPSTVMFHLPTIVLGLFGHRFPRTVNMEDIRLHKTTNLSSGAYLLSMTSSRQYASLRGNKSFITLDSTPFRQHCIDVHQSYRHNQWTFPARMEPEKEHVALAVLFTSVKSITINDKTINNPFYIADCTKDEDFQSLYLDYLALLRQLAEPGSQNRQNQSSLEAFVKAYLDYYEARTANDNPFKLSLDELKTSHPEFMQAFLANNLVCEQEKTTMEALINRQVENLVKDHAYGSSLMKSKPFDPTQVVTVYDDPYSYGFYE